MKKKILIIEDNPKWMDTIKKVVSLVSFETDVFTASDLKDAYQIAMENSIDLFIIDIILNVQKPGDVSGMDFADNIRQHAKYRFTPVIFITSLEDIKLKAYSNIHCYSYIEKPFDEEKTLKIIEEALEIPLKKEKKKEYIYFRKDGILYGFHIDEITHIESNNHKTCVYSIHENVITGYRSIKSLLNELDSKVFVQCNRSTIVNKKHIEYVDPANRFMKLRNMDSQIEIGAIIKNNFLREIEND